MAPMSIRSWFENWRRREDADAIEHAKEDWAQAPEELSRGGRRDQIPDGLPAERVGDRPDDINRPGDLPPL